MFLSFPNDCKIQSLKFNVVVKSRRLSFTTMSDRRQRDMANQTYASKPKISLYCLLISPRQEHAGHIYNSITKRKCQVLTQSILTHDIVYIV